MHARLAGREVPIVWRGRRARAFVPTLLARRDLTLTAETVARAATAGGVKHRVAPAWSPIVDRGLRAGL